MLSNGDTAGFVIQEPLDDGTGSEWTDVSSSDKDAESKWWAGCAKIVERLRVEIGSDGVPVEDLTGGCTICDI